MGSKIEVHRDKNQIDVNIENGSYDLRDFLKLAEMFKSAAIDAGRYSYERMT